MKQTIKPVSLVLASVVFISNAWAGDISLRCTHIQGERLYKGSDAVEVRRNGAAVNVKQIPPTQDNWTYRIIFEEDALGFRALRSAKPDGGSTPFDVPLGGELIYIIDGSDQRLLVTATNAASRQVTSAQLRCRNAP